MRSHSMLPVILALAAGCTPTIKTQNEVTIKPVQVTLDINLKVDQALTEALSADAPNSSSAVAAAVKMCSVAITDGSSRIISAPESRAPSRRKQKRPSRSSCRAPSLESP